MSDKFEHPWHELPISKSDALVMHVDMNSCFATMEQQSNPLLRGKPVGVAAYDAPYGCVISPSYEAKAKGVKVGMRVKDAKAACPGIAIIQSNPPLYRDAHMRFRRIFEDYSDRVTPKSIDEAVIDFHGMDELRKGRSLTDIGYEIKDRVHKEIGEWVNVNVGIAPNRFLAKTAAGLHKPNGLDVITQDNLLEIYRGMDLLDITGINTRFAARLMREGIMTPMDFFRAPIQKLTKQVFQSVIGYQWHARLRGWEVDDREFSRKSIGHDYTLQDRSGNPVMLRKFLMKLCEKTGRRMRTNRYYAGGIHVWVAFDDYTSWHEGHKTNTRLYTTSEIFHFAMELFSKRPPRKVITHMGISVYDLQPDSPKQLGLFDATKGDKNALSQAMDAVNDRYGNMVIGSALLMNMDNFILDRVPFGSTKDMQELYASDKE